MSGPVVTTLNLRAARREILVQAAAVARSRRELGRLLGVRAIDLVSIYRGEGLRLGAA